MTDQEIMRLFVKNEQEIIKLKEEVYRLRVEIERLKRQNVFKG